MEFCIEIYCDWCAQYFMSPALRRVAGRCRPDRRCSSFAKRTRTSGRRRAKKQLRQCPDSVATSKQTDSDITEERRRRNDTQTQHDDDIECTQSPINERLSIPNEYNDKHLEDNFSFSKDSSKLKSIRHSSSYCSNCGDYVPSISIHNTFRSLPNYSAGDPDHSFIDLSPENSSGPISFDSGIEQPYKDTRSSPIASLLSLSKNDSSKHSRNIEDHHHTADDKSSRLTVQLPIKQTKSTETQTDWVPFRILVVERDQIFPAKSIFELKHRNLKSDSSNKLLRVTRRTRGRKWTNNPSNSSNNIEEDQDRVYHSDSAINSEETPKMPVGASFENSAMKSSFSLSSLQGAATGGPKGSPLRAPANQERPYHSLTKKRKDTNRELWRRSWGSTYSNQSIQSLSSATLAAKDDFWAALQPNYNYIMDNQLIDSCREANGELDAEATPPISLTLPKDLPSSSSQWNLGQLIADFTELCQWLTNIQEEVYASPENLANRTLRAKRMAELKACDNRRRRFMEQCAGALARGGVIEQSEVTWRARHLALKWDSVLQVMSPEHANSNQIISDAEHEVRCLRRWLREMEVRLPPLSLTAAAAWSRLQLDQKFKEHEVLQREVEWHGRIVSSVVRLCRLGPAEAVAKGLERRWHHLYLLALEWQCHLESCLSKKDAESLIEPSQLTDSDEEPVTKHPRLVGPDDSHEKTSLAFAKQIAGIFSSDESEDDNEDLIEEYYNATSPGSDADTEGSIPDDERDVIMASLPHVDDKIMIDDLIANMPVLDTNDIAAPYDTTTQTTPNGQQDRVVGLEQVDCVDGLDVTLETSLYEDQQQTPVTVVKRPKKVNDSKFRSTNRKSKNLAVYYFKHQDTESDTQLISGTDDRSQDDTSEEEWTYTPCDKETSAENTDVMTSSVENPEELRESDHTVKNSAKMKLEFDSNSETLEQTDIMQVTTPVKTVKPPVPESIIRLVKQADEMVQKKAQEMNSVPIELMKTIPKKTKAGRNLELLNLNGKIDRSKMSRIQEWLQKNNDDESETSQQQVLDSCDASGEYTTGDSDRQSVTSEELSPSVATYCNINSSQEHSINLATPTHQGPPKVVLRGKRSSTQNTRPWSVSCLSQLNYNIKDTSASAANTPTNDKLDTVVAYGRSGMSISESALNTLASSPNIRGQRKDKFQGSTSSVKTAIQAHLSSSTTLNEGCVTCNENLSDKKCSMRRKRQKLRRKQQGIASEELETAELRLAQTTSNTVGNRLVKSCSFSGKSSMKDDKHDRCSSDPSSTRNKHRLDTTSTSDNDSEEENTAPLQSHLGQSTDHTMQPSASEDQNLDTEPLPDVTPKFKLGPEGGRVRPRLPFANLERERASLFGLTIVERSVLTELVNTDRDSDVDRSVQTAGTEEHSSFSEQAWDYFCQEKYQSEAYSEEAPDSDAARHLLDFGDDYRAFIDSQSDACSSLSAHPDASPLMNRRKYPLQNHSPSANRSALDSPENGSFGRRSKKSSASSFDRKKSLMDSLERSRNGNSEDSERLKRAKKILSDSLERKRLQASDLDYSSDRRKHTSTSSDLCNSSLEYQSANQLNGFKPDIIDSLNRRNRKGSSESTSRHSDDSVPRQGDTSHNSSLESPSRRKRLSHDYSDSSHKNSLRRRGSNNANLLQMDRRGFNSDSDTDDITHLMDSSRSQLEEAESVIAKEDVTPDLLQINDYRDLLATCNENIRCLEAVLAEASEGILPAAKHREITGLIARWNTVHTAGERRLTARRLHREILTLKGGITGPRNEEKPALHSRTQIHHRIEDLRARLAVLKDQNATMVKLNVSVRRLLTEIKSNSSGNCISDTLCDNLSGEVTELYVLWNESFESTNTELQSLETALEAWKNWEQGMAELRGALRGDCDTVRLIEAALAAGDPARVAPHVTKLATLLSEANNQKGECGSLSDSGLSDSGCEQDLSEREKRLAELRSSARAMEAVLAPGSKLLKGITKRMEQAELELRTLQTTCRELIVRTAVGVASAGSTQVEKSSWDVASRLSMSSGRRSSLSENSMMSPDDPDSDPSKSSSPLNEKGKRWAWCALPLQICLLALLCACLMGGPRCCDAVNNLSTGFTPQLRYTRGPPPM